MLSSANEKLLKECQATLRQNNLGRWTRPAPNLYPHQWFWDSCFIAIGLRHINVKRAQQEIESLFRGQWQNGMIPNIIYGDGIYYADNAWDSSRSSDAPKDVKTSGVSQPPMLAEAVVRVGEKLTKKERHKWYKKVFPKIVAYHEWLYRERDPHNVGLAALVHPWESGLDNNPAWFRIINKYRLPLWIKLIHLARIDKLIEKARKDTRFVAANERTTTVEQLVIYNIANDLKRARYQSKKILAHSKIALEDVAFNSILIRANQHLFAIAKEIEQPIPGWLLKRMVRAQKSLDLLWDKQAKQYFHRRFKKGTLVQEPSIVTFLPLYAGTISKERAKQLVDLLKSEAYWTPFPVPTTPITSKYFQPQRYWQGPAWINANWLIMDGLRRYGYHDEADHIKERTLELVRKGGSFEYFNPLNGLPAGVQPFSWTASLAIDLLYE